jgi:hypothetical protein
LKNASITDNHGVDKPMTTDLKALALQALGVNLKVDRRLNELSTKPQKKVVKSTLGLTVWNAVKLSDLHPEDGAYFGLEREPETSSERLKEFGRILSESLDGEKKFNFRCKPRELRELAILTRLLAPACWEVMLRDNDLRASPKTNMRKTKADP